MRIKPTESKALIVLLGHFNPLIFTPSWFSKHGVIGEVEAEKADIELVHRELVRFRLDWLKLSVD